MAIFTGAGVALVTPFHEDEMCIRDRLSVLPVLPELFSLLSVDSSSEESLSS